jgi:hypothetical protein
MASTFSVQQVIDCTYNKFIKSNGEFINGGIDGGDPSIASLLYNGGVLPPPNPPAMPIKICTTGQYPYRNPLLPQPQEPYLCRTTQFCDNSNIQIRSFRFNPTNTGLTEYIKTGPVVVAIVSRQSIFQNAVNGRVPYTSNLFTPLCGYNLLGNELQLDHSVLIVGYVNNIDPLNPLDNYWKIKNSWGTIRGDHGYWYIKAGVNEFPLGSGLCGIKQPRNKALYNIVFY